MKIKNSSNLLLLAVYKYGLQFLSVLVLLISFQSCRKYLEVDVPDNLVLSKKVFSSNETANSAILNIYGQMFNSSVPYNLSFTTGIAGDELKTYFSLARNTYLNAVQASTGPIVNFWPIGFNYIYQANAVYEGCEASTTLDPEVRQQLMGEALFIRAYWHFYLFNLYGDIPIVITTDYLQNSKSIRSAKNAVYSQIIADLRNSIEKLNENYVGANGIASTMERIRPNKSAAIALLARTYLYNEEYNKAEEQASLLINNTRNYALTNLSDVFLANSEESIWQLKASPTSFYNTPEGLNYILISSPVVASGCEISTQLLSAFDNNDLRKTIWIAKYTDNSTVPAIDYFYPSKYKIKATNDGKEYSMQFRLAEQYLIRAEAKAQTGKIAEAIKDVDMIRKRAGLLALALINPGIAKTELLTAIYKERQKELFSEQGHRWLDMKRTNIINTNMEVMTPLKGGGVWNSTKQIWPIPQRDILANPGLKQNEGYN